MARIDLAPLVSPHYDQNLRKYGESEASCLLCGKQIRNLSTATMVHLLTTGQLTDDTDPVADKEDQGYFLVGPDCAGKLPPSFRQKPEEH